MRAAFLTTTLEGTPEIVYLSLPGEIMLPFRRALGRPLPPAVAALTPPAAVRV